jgi:hypothetical protein
MQLNDHPANKRLVDVSRFAFLKSLSLLNRIYHIYLPLIRNKLRKYVAALEAKCVCLQRGLEKVHTDILIVELRLNPILQHTISTKGEHPQCNFFDTTSPADIVMIFYSTHKLEPAWHRARG